MLYGATGKSDVHGIFGRRVREVVVPKLLLILFVLERTSSLKKAARCLGKFGNWPRASQASAVVAIDVVTTTRLKQLGRTRRSYPFSADKMRFGASSLRLI